VWKGHKYPFLPYIYPERQAVLGLKETVGYGFLTPETQTRRVLIDEERLVFSYTLKRKNCHIHIM
jgi:hypothetical protein